VGPPSSRRTPLRLCVLLSHLREVQGRVQVTVLNMPALGLLAGEDSLSQAQFGAGAECTNQSAKSANLVSN
jgi:hypothetical protein